ncbi:hypothetical protein ACHAW6_008507 [Cyclotella cf. meneghiniana]
MVPLLCHNSLISTSKLADANYYTVFTPDEVLIYDGEVEPTKIPVWKGWRDNETGLWQVPLTEKVTNANTQTKLLQQDEMIHAFQEPTLSVYNLPSKADPLISDERNITSSNESRIFTSWPGLNPKDSTPKQILKNKISKAYEKAIEKHGMDMESVPKEAHWRNAAKKSIQTTQNHLKAILAGCDDSFLMHLWDRLLPQAELTCNLLHPVNINQNVPAYQYVHGNHDYNKHPHHPLGCKVQAFIDTKT